MKTITFRGHSDDIFSYEVDVGGADEQDSCGRDRPLVYEVRSGVDGLRVIGMYAVTSGTWMIGVEGVDREDDAMPDWTGTVAFEGYSTVLTLDVPANATIARVDAYPLRIQGRK